MIKQNKKKRRVKRAHALQKEFPLKKAGKRVHKIHKINKSRRLKKMFSIGFGELLVIFVITLVFLGPKNLIKLTKILANIIKELKKLFEKE